MFEKRVEMMKRKVKKGGVAVVIAAIALSIMAMPAWAKEKQITDAKGDVVWDGGIYTDTGGDKKPVIHGIVTVTADTAYKAVSGVYVKEGIVLNPGV